MPACVHEIELARTSQLGYYRNLDHFDPLVEELRRLGRSVSERLNAGRVWMLNSTASGGGVAELLPRLCNLLEDVKVDARWLVLDPGDPEFFRVTKAVHNMLHGEPGLSAEELSRAHDIYDRVSCETAAHLRHLSHEDVLVVHDPQPAGVAVHLREELRPRLVWRCHIGVPESNEHTQVGWDFLHSYLEPYGRMIFSSAGYIPDAYVPRSGVIAPGIDPLSHKNRPLHPYKLVGILNAARLVAGPPVPSWARFAAPAQRLIDGEWVVRPIENLLHHPIVLQVSRFDRLKGFQFLIPAFAALLSRDPRRAPHLHTHFDRFESELSRVQLVLAGPDPGGVSDDPEAAEVLETLCRQIEALPSEISRRIHLLRLPMVDAKQNALVVNALQRLATVVVQNSVREGFGLTVAEALWKATPVVAANVGGIAVQMRHGVDGLLVHDPSDVDGIADALLQAIAQPKEMEALARAGRMRVREHFLVLSQLHGWLRELDRMLPPRQDAAPET